MAFSINGFGTGYCASQGHVYRSKRKTLDVSADPTDYDAVLAIQFAFLPVIPLQVVHIFDRHGLGLNFKMNTMRLAWSWSTIFKTFLARWLWLPFVLGVLMSIGCIIGVVNDRAKLDHKYFILCGIAVGLILIPIAFWQWRRARNRFTQRIRMLLGPSEVGSSDPMTWPEPVRNCIPKPQQMFELSPSFAAACERLIQQGRWGESMYAARLCASFENQQLGDELTSRILAQPEVIELLHQLEQHPDRWHEFMPPVSRGLSRSPAKPTEATLAH